MNRLYMSGGKESRQYVGYNDSPRVFGEQFAISPETITFLVPVDGDEVVRDSEDFAIQPTTYFVDRRTYTTEFYNATKSNMAKIAVVYAAAPKPGSGVGIANRSSALLITAISTVSTEEGESVKKLTGYYGGALISVAERKPGAAGDVKVGDAIQIARVDGELTSTRSLMRLSNLKGLTEEEKLSQMFSNTTAYNADLRYMFCRVGAADQYAMRVTVDNDYYFTYVLDTTARVYIYDTKEEEFLPAAAGDIRKDDFLFIRGEVGRPYDIVVVR